jgi:hypothetical protein
MNGLIKGAAKKLPENVNSAHKCVVCLSTAVYPLPIIYGCVVGLIFRGEQDARSVLGRMCRVIIIGL